MSVLPSWFWGAGPAGGGVGGVRWVGCRWDRDGKSCRGDLLAGASPRPLAGDDQPALEDLPAPDAPRLAAGECAGQAGAPDRAVAAEGLSRLQLCWGLGEPQAGFLDPARLG